ncbi:hypothetical protein [Thermomonospora echinospora]|uniref:hypothetical protein n=1 Tax=Thermomonospora echinospora TaxID=1992 RepID=UPI000CDF1CAA|nr:hypothetical protein [Thermomonospora echinospora]
MANTSRTHQPNSRDRDDDQAGEPMRPDRADRADRADQAPDQDDDAAGNARNKGRQPRDKGRGKMR